MRMEWNIYLVRSTVVALNRTISRRDTHYTDKNSKNSTATRDVW